MSNPCPFRWWQELTESEKEEAADRMCAEIFLLYSKLSNLCHGHELTGEFLDSLLDYATGLIDLPEDQNPSDRMDYGGPDDYCWDWLLDRLSEIRSIEDAERLVVDCNESTRMWNARGMIGLN